MKATSNPLPSGTRSRDLLPADQEADFQAALVNEYLADLQRVQDVRDLVNARLAAPQVLTDICREVDEKWKEYDFGS